MIIYSLLDKIQEEIIDKKIPVRGMIFGGTKIEIYQRDLFVVVLEMPMGRFDNPEDNLLDCFKVGDYLWIEISYEKVVDILNGKSKLIDQDWAWDDE